jgi:predicted Zn-dependent peptidase
MPGHTTTEVADAIHSEIERLKNEDVSDEELKMIKTRAKANLLRSLDNNEGLASDLSMFQTRYGDWRELFRSVDRIDKVSKADIRRVANLTFVTNNRTVGIIETAKPENDKKAADQPSGSQGGAQ